MREELEQVLYKDFPKLYEQHVLPYTETCMCNGFDCDDGWYDLIYELSKKITEMDKNVVAVQVKEKFGGLRFYIEGTYNKDVFDVIDEYEERSYKICEECGTTENVSLTGSWVRSLCMNCRK